MSLSQNLPNDIRNAISLLRQKYDLSSTLEGAAGGCALAKQRKDMKTLSNLMDSYYYFIEAGTFEKSTSFHRSQYDELQQEISHLQKCFDYNQNTETKKRKLFKSRNKSQKEREFNYQQQTIIQLGNQAQKESEEAAKRILQGLDQMHGRADEIVTQLDRQIKKLDETYDRLCQTGSILKRIERHLKTFSRQIYTDRLMICMIIVIAIVIIVIIGLAIAGKTPKALRSTVQ